MRFRLEGYLEFNSPIDFLEGRFQTLIPEKVNAELFRKGVPKEQEGSKITFWKVMGMRLLVIIEGTKYLRPHDALLRLRKFLGSELGKKFRIGVRKVFVKEYQIEYEPILKPLEKLVIYVPLVEEITFEKDILKIKLRNLDDRCLEERYVERILERIEEKIAQQHYRGKGEHWELVWKSPKKKPVWKKDPSKELEKLGEIKRFNVGVWFHNTFTSKLMRVMEQIALKYILKPLEFIEIILPKVIPLEVWKKTEHVPGSSNSFFYVSRPLSLDPKFWEDFADWVKITGEIPSDLLKQKISLPNAGICFAQCPPFYWFFQKKLIPEDKLPYKVFDRSGVSYRWEGGGLHGLERDCEFHRIEIIWLGLKDQVIEIKEKLLERFKHVFDKILELEWRLAKVTPWYMSQAGMLGKEIEAEVGTLDFEAWLPWRGPREKSEWLEFQNLTVAGTKFSNAWKYKTDKGNEVWSGCSGIGLERWVVAFLSQKGIDPKKWPQKFKELFGKLPKKLEVV